MSQRAAGVRKVPGGFAFWGAATTVTAGGWGAALGRAAAPVVMENNPLGRSPWGRGGWGRREQPGPAERSWLSAGCWLRSPLAAADRRREVLKIPSAPPGAAFPGTTLTDAGRGVPAVSHVPGGDFGRGVTASKGDTKESSGLWSFLSPPGVVPVGIWSWRAS